MFMSLFIWLWILKHCCCILTMIRQEQPLLMTRVKLQVASLDGFDFER